MSQNSHADLSHSTQSSHAILVTEIKKLVIESVGLHHLKEADIHSETSLRQGGLELDSVDLLEVVVMVEQKYGVKVTDAEAGKTYFRTLGTIADFVEMNRAPR